MTLTPETVNTALQRLHEIVGQPGEVSTMEQSPPLIDALHNACNDLVAEWGQKLAEMVVQLIEQPEYRLAGAEEAVRQLVATLEETLQHHEALSKELTGRAADALKRIPTMLANYQKSLAAAKKPAAVAAAASAAADLVELIRFYPRWRYQGLVLQELARGYLSLRGHLSDQLREINFCRIRLDELGHPFAYASGSDIAGHGNPASPSLSHDEGVPDSRHAHWSGRCLFPGGCRTLDQAAGQFLDTVQPSEVMELDQQIQKMIQQEFTALVHVCLVANNVQKKLAAAMAEETEKFVSRGWRKPTRPSYS